MEQLVRFGRNLCARRIRCEHKAAERQRRARTDTPHPRDAGSKLQGQEQSHLEVLNSLSLISRPFVG
jgi:hypothetical protein